MTVHLLCRDLTKRPELGGNRSTGLWYPFVCFAAVFITSAEEGTTHIFGHDSLDGGTTLP